MYRKGNTCRRAMLTKAFSRACTPAKYLVEESGQSEMDSASAEVLAGLAESAETTSTQSSACRW